MSCQRISAVASAAALVIGVPVALVMVVGWPLPTVVPAPEAVWTAVSIGNVSTTVLIKALACVVWIAWAQIAYSAAVEVLASARRTVVRPARLVPAPLQLGVGRLVATAALIFVLAPRPVAGNSQPTVPINAQAAVSTVALDLAPPSYRSLVDTTMPIAGDELVGAESIGNPAASTSWTVKRGDNLWDIASASLGDGERFVEIFDLNQGRPQQDGGALTDPGVLEAGWVLVLPVDNAQSPHPPTETAESSSALAPPPPDYVVAPGDSLSSIAFDHLGDGNRWPEIYDVNRGESQPDGRVLSDPNVLEPGWNLVIPEPPPVVGEATAGPPVIIEAVPGGEAPATPIPPPSTPPIIESVPGLGSAADAPQPPVVTDAPDSKASPEPAPTPIEEPDMAEPPPAPDPTSTLEPPLPFPEPTGGTAPTESLAPSEAAPDASTTDPPGVPTDGGELAQMPLPVLGAAAGVLAFGSWAAIRRARRHQSALRRPGTEAPELSNETRTTLAEVRQGAIDSPADEIRLLLGSLSKGLGLSRGRAAPQPLALIVRDEVAELRLDEPWADAPTGWSISPDGRGWTRSRRPLPVHADQQILLPAVVTIGGTTDGPVLLDLEAAGVISVIGSGGGPDDLARSIVTELAVGPFADAIRVLVCGVALPDRPDAAVIEEFDDIDDALNELRSDAEQYRSALADGGIPSGFAARAMDVASDGFPPTVLITNVADDRVSAAALDLPSKSGVALLVVGAIDAPALEIHLDEGLVVIPEIGLRCAAQSMTIEAAEQLAAVLAQVSAEPVAVDDDLVVSAFLATLGREPQTAAVACESPISATVDLRSEDRAEYHDPEFDLCVRLLGTIDVDGSPSKLSEQQVAVLAYMATHRDADKPQISEALWRDDQPNKARLSNLLYQIRRSVGSDALPAGTDRSQLLGDRVVTDLDLFDGRVAAAADMLPAAALEVLEQALELVRGPILTYSNRAARFYSWIDLENITSVWERKIADIAHRVSAQRRENGDADAAARVAMLGLKAVPLNDVLICDLMLAREAAGNLQAVRRTFEEYERSLDHLDLGEPAEEVWWRYSTRSSFGPARPVERQGIVRSSTEGGAASERCGPDVIPQLRSCSRRLRRVRSGTACRTGRSRTTRSRPLQGRLVRESHWCQR